MNKFAKFLTSVFLVIGFISNAQDIVWTGSASNNDFFDENNWKNSDTNLAPTAGSIEPAVAINLSLKINNVATTITANGIIALGTGSLSIDFCNLVATSFSGGAVSVNESAYIELSSSSPLASAVQVNFTSGLSWIRTLNYSVRFVSLTNLGQIKVNGIASTYKDNLRLDNYYLKGCVIRPNLQTTTPLTIYDGINLSDASAAITVNTIHSGASIANSMNNKIESFLLKKGYMVTFAVEEDGTGKSKNYIASESDLIINAIPKLLLNSISFIRVMPWNWVTKKGRNNIGTDLNTTWRYQWNWDDNSGIFWEFAPMSWGHGTTTDIGIANFVGRYNTPYLMSFNEPDDCSGQSGQYGFPGSPKLCDIDEAVRLHKNLMKTGMRIVSPGGREEAPFGWLKEFYAKATAQDVRVDVIAVHWYDWSTAITVPNPTAQQVFDRFKAYLTNVHNLYGLPIWITEFNANPARSQAINEGFLKLALPYLESLEYIERYCWFPYNTGTHFYTTLDASATTLSQVGTIYKNINNTTPTASTPSIPEATVDAKNNLNLLTYPNIAFNKPVTANSSPYAIENDPTKAVDGDNTSQWIVNIKIPTGTNYAPLPAWLEVDLQGTYIIDSFKMLESFNSSKDFSFEVWDLSLNSGAGGWRSVVNVTANPANSTTTFKNFAAETTTKVRLYITVHNSSNILRFLELEVYGTPVETLKVKQYEIQPFSLFPNPVSDGIVNIIGDKEIWSIDVYDLLGTKINTVFENQKLLVHHLASGVYVLKINKHYTLKLIKK